MNNDIVEISDAMLHEVVGALQSIRCGSDQTLTVEPQGDGSVIYTCD